MQNKEEIIRKINLTLEQIRPYLQADGGDVILSEVTDDLTVRVRLTGACHGCPFSMQTLRAGVEQALRHSVPEIKEVQSVQ
jgi:Fe-S cluster biogenesis protein NfuA